MPVLMTAEASAEQTLTFAIGSGTVVVDSFPELERATQGSSSRLIVVGPDADLDETLRFAERLRDRRPEAGVVLVRRRLDTGLLVQAMRAGVRDVVKFDDLGALADACRRCEDIALRLAGDVGDDSDSGPQRARGQVITVFSGKGGSGKTTVATNTAVALATGGQRVCLVDLDLMFGDVAIALQLVPERSMVEAVALAGKLDRLGVESLVTRHPSGVDTVLAPVQPGTADSISADVVAELIGIARTMYDVVVVDTPPAFTDHVLAAFDQTDAFLLLCALDVPSIKNLKLTIETMELLRYPRERWHLVVNRADSRVGLSVSDVEKTVGLHSVAQIPSDRLVPASLNRGVPIVTEHPKHAVSMAVRKLATAVLAEPAPAPASNPSEPGQHAQRDRSRLSLLRRGAGA